MIVAGNKIYERCSKCNRIVCISGIFGGLHFCTGDCFHDYDLWAGRFVYQTVYCKYCGEESVYRPNFVFSLLGIGLLRFRCLYHWIRKIGRR